MDFKYAVSSAAGKVGHFTRVAVKKTGEAAELAKLRVAFISEKRKLEGMFSTLGKLFYEQVKGTDVRVQIAAQIMEIDEQKAVISKLKSDIVAAKGKAVCAGCGSPIDSEAAFCPACGERQFVKKNGSFSHMNKEASDLHAGKPLSCEDFVDTFKDISAKYF